MKTTILPFGGSITFIDKYCSYFSRFLQKINLISRYNKYMVESANDGHIIRLIIKKAFAKPERFIFPFDKSFLMVFVRLSSKTLHLNMTFFERHAQ